jgi:nucleoside-triphosphatase
MKSVCLITGMPGVGKTSLIKQAIESAGIRAGGFYTEEIRLHEIREGFRIVTLDGKTALLSHINIHSPFRVSKYGVDINVMDGLGVDAIKQAAGSGDLVVIDEIGKMELLSERFKSGVWEIVESGKSVLGTIMLKPDPWADLIKQKPQVNLVTLTRNNREEALGIVLEWLKERFSRK